MLPINSDLFHKMAVRLQLFTISFNSYGVMMYQHWALMPPVLYVRRGDQAKWQCIYTNLPLMGTSCLAFLTQQGFIVSVGAIARQWVHRAAICQCLAASGNADGWTRFRGRKKKRLLFVLRLKVQTDVALRRECVSVSIAYDTVRDAID